MTGLCHADAVHGPRASGARSRLIACTVDGLQLAATPTFALMALVTASAGNGASDILCAAALDASPLSGMVPMYVLMSAFHAGPWLRLMGR
jgi:hypothetical protein